MKSKRILSFYLLLMAGLTAGAIYFKAELPDLMSSQFMYKHLLFLHIVSVTLFFSNAVIGTLWELRSLNSNRKDIILHTYGTVSWLDARFTSPLIVLSVFSGIMLTLMYGDLWQIGWLSLSFLLFLLSGAVWLVSDIPTQYKIKKLVANIDPDAKRLPQELLGLLKKRIWISLADVLPLLTVFILMVYKPDIIPVALWFH